MIPQMGNVCNELESAIPEAAVPTIVETCRRYGMLEAIRRLLLVIKGISNLPNCQCIRSLFRKLCIVGHIAINFVLNDIPGQFTHIVEIYLISN